MIVIASIESIQLLFVSLWHFKQSLDWFWSHLHGWHRFFPRTPRSEKICCNEPFTNGTREMIDQLSQNSARHLLLMTDGYELCIDMDVCIYGLVFCVPTPPMVWVPR